MRMVPMTISNRMLVKHTVACYVLCVTEQENTAPLNNHFSLDIVELVKSVAQQRHFNAKQGQILSVPVLHEGKLVTIVLVGLGKLKDSDAANMEVYRRAVAATVRVAEQQRCATVAFQMPSAQLFNTSDGILVEQAAIIVSMAAYHFDVYITDQERKTPKIEEFFLVGSFALETVDSHFETGKLIAQSVNMARSWIDLPPHALTPIEVVQRTKKMAQETGLDLTVFNEHEINQMGMGGLAAVARGSDHDCQLVILEYKSGKANVPRLCFVGKGITFDSGGLSIKPATAMETMKEDMSGAAAVIAAMQAIAILKPDVDVIGITPLTENMPSGKATKPGDIVTFYNGKTAEIKNTDAEGRLILADALSYAVKHYHPLDALIDVATLTGSCAHALGPFFSGLMTQDRKLEGKIRESADRTGDRVWPLPLDDDYKKSIRSPVADICNIGSSKYKAGAITAAHFLGNFVEDVSWAHLDIAGTAFDVPDIAYYRPDSATGAAVRLLIDLARSWKR